MAQAKKKNASSPTETDEPAGARQTKNLAATAPAIVFTESLKARTGLPHVKVLERFLEWLSKQDVVVINEIMNPTGNVGAIFVARHLAAVEGDKVSTAEALRVIRVMLDQIAREDAARHARAGD